MYVSPKFNADMPSNQTFQLQAYYNTHQPNLTKMADILETQVGKIIDASLTYLLPASDDATNVPRGNSTPIKHSNTSL